jgi:hypothetical protein
MLTIKGQVETLETLGGHSQSGDFNNEMKSMVSKEKA